MSRFKPGPKETRGTGLVAVACVGLFAAACAETVKEVKAPQGAATRRHYQVECIELDQCKERAAEACGSSYEVVSEWHNTIPESDLPGINDRSLPMKGRDFDDLTLPLQTGIESDEPMPVASLVVACNR